MSSAKVEVTKKVRFLVKVSHFFSLFTTGKIDHLYKEVFLAAILFGFIRVTIIDHDGFCPVDMS